jgi:hypothetical protein
LASARRPVTTLRARDSFLWSGGTCAVIAVPSLWKAFYRRARSDIDSIAVSANIVGTRFADRVAKRVIDDLK